MKLLPIVAALSFIGCCASAPAATPLVFNYTGGWPDLSVTNGAYFDHYFDASQTDYAFTDAWSFSVGADPATAYGRVVEGRIDFGEIYLIATDGSSRHDFAPTLNNGSLVWDLNAVTLPANTAYLLVLKGETSDEPFANYIGVLGVSAVPEPRSWALLLAGLGAAGVVTRRRRHDARMA